MNSRAAPHCSRRARTTQKLSEIYQSVYIYKYAYNTRRDVADFFLILEGFNRNIFFGWGPRSLRHIFQLHSGNPTSLAGTLKMQLLLKLRDFNGCQATIRKCNLKIFQVATQYVRQFNTSTWQYCTHKTPQGLIKNAHRHPVFLHQMSRTTCTKTQAKHRLYHHQTCQLWAVGVS